MNRIFKTFMLVCGLVAAASCNKMTPEQMARKADQIKYECNPEVLTLINGKVDARITVEFPKAYFYPEVVMDVTPVLVYDGGEIEAPHWIYQGENVKENNKTISRKGTIAKERVTFDYKDGMQRSRLVARSVILFSGKVLALPDVTIAEGISTVGLFAELDGEFDFKADGYQAVLKRSTEGQVMYTVGSAKIRKDQLKSHSIEDYQDRVENLKLNSRYRITGNKIVSYASPEGGKKLNDKLSSKRSDSAQKAWNTVGKGRKAEEVEVKSIGQDWEGFKEAVAKSDIPDKHLILRVLQMYNDPALRESEIRNLSAIYRELKADVFPELRRTRFITEMDYDNYTMEELEELGEKKIYMLDEEALLRLASISNDPDRKIFLYNFCYEKWGSKRAAFNVAVQTLKDGRTGATEVYLDRLNDEEDPEVMNLRGLLEMSRANWYKSEDLFEKALFNQADLEFASKNIGIVNMLQGNYEKAADVLKDGNINKTVSCLLCGRLDEAEKSITWDDAHADYLRAVICARRGDKEGMKKALDNVLAKEPSYKEAIEKDVEFRKLLLQP